MKRLAFVLSIIILFAVPSAALADIAPPQNPPGSNLDPGSEVTQVRMLAETVLINVQKDSTPGSLGRAHVTADFTMQNLGTESEQLAVRFPIAINNGYDNSYPEITNIAIQVNGNRVGFQRSDYVAEFGSFHGDTVPWAEFDVIFPAGKNVAIQVAYDLKGTGFTDQPYTSFYYTLATGAGWKDTIGSADIILRLPYPASAQNVLLGYSDSPPAADANFQGNEVRWHLENFEPSSNGPASNLEFDLVTPAVWQTVVTELDNVTKNPNDGEAWGRLGKAYKTAIITVKLFRTGPLYRSDPGGEELYQLSVDAYQKCLALLPNDALWHAGFAELLAIHAYSNKESGDADRANEEINTALQLAPNHPLVLKSAYNVHSTLGDKVMQIGPGYFDFPLLGPTQERLPPMFNVAAIPGTYQINEATYYGKNVQLTFKLHSDFSATMEMRFEDGQKYTASGTWKPGDINITLSLIDQFKEPMAFDLYVEGPPSHNLVISNNQSVYFFDNQDHPELINLAYPPTSTNTPAPTLTLRPPRTLTPSRTPRPTFTPLPTETPRSTFTTQPTPSKPTATPAPQAPSSLCGSAMLIPLIAILWLGRKRMTTGE
jgi:tetratricopeptide (TPR) repeat protein